MADPMHVLYPGSFDPPTSGHLAMAEKAHSLFGEVTVVVAFNPDKKAWLPVEERLDLFREMTSHLEGLKVMAWEGLIAHLANEIGANAILKGLRSEGDFRQEQVMAEANSRIGGGLPTLFLVADGCLQGVSSSLVRQVHQLGGDISPFVPATIVDRLKDRE